MGFLNDIFTKMATAAGKAAKEAFEEKFAEVEGKAYARLDRRLAPVPDDVDEIIAATPPDEVPEIPYRFHEMDNTAIFLDSPVTEDDVERGWAPGRVRGREVRILIPSKEEFLAILHDAISDD